MKTAREVAEDCGAMCINPRTGKPPELLLFAIETAIASARAEAIEQAANEVDAYGGYYAPKQLAERIRALKERG